MPQIIEITTGAATSFNHPREQFSNFKPSITVKALVTGDEDPILVARILQLQAEDLVSAEKARILAALKLQHDIRVAADELAIWEEAVAKHEEVIAKEKPRLSNPDELAALNEWEHRDLAHRVSTAEDCIESARRSLASAREELATLTGDRRAVAA